MVRRRPFPAPFVHRPPQPSPKVFLDPRTRNGLSWRCLMQSVARSCVAFDQHVVRAHCGAQRVKSTDQNRGEISPSCSAISETYVEPKSWPGRRVLQNMQQLLLWLTPIIIYDNLEEQ